ncbi:DEKNAAC101774 [Brettanomyces naardenensis]|uniref:guanosine-diphosphatase n=1 Tax=Brettanomyces naardenensis TaxID=13370 RepID=A0A448YJ05_BRENA|nr:DEKNAAC101774 [Brettanomyces naardenensis]
MASSIRKNRLLFIGIGLFAALLIFLVIPSQKASSLVAEAGFQRVEAGFGIPSEPESGAKYVSGSPESISYHSAPSVETSLPSSKDSCSNKKEYVVMIDAGSTGSRIHVYTFDTCFSPPKLLDEQFKMLKPGLSSFDKDTIGAAKSLDPLLQVALDTIPKNKQGCSPVAVKATAGLRLLGEEKSSAILREVSRHLEKDFPFPVVTGDGVSIMDGSDEGVYAWITTNYLLGNIGSKEITPTVAVFDLGGGSTQIVFEPVEGEKMLEGAHKYEIDFGGRHFVLYQYSHLGYGLMQGRRRLNSLVVNLTLEKGGSTHLVPLTEAQKKDFKSLNADVTLKHPCVPPGVKAENVKVEMDDGSVYLVNFISPAKDESDPLAASASTQCRFLAESVLNKDADCESKSCSFNGIYQPSLRHKFPVDSDMFIFSYFYDRLEPIGMPASFSLQEMTDITQLVCSGSSLWNQFFLQKQSIQELEQEPLWCLDLSFMTVLLHTGYDIPLNRELRTAKTIAGNELGWCLGASLPLLDKNSGWSCRVSKDY